MASVPRSFPENLEGQEREMPWKLSSIDSLCCCKGWYRLLVVITALEADDTSTWQTRHQVEEDRRVWRVGFRRVSHSWTWKTLGNVLGGGVLLWRHLLCHLSIWWRFLQIMLGTLCHRACPVPAGFSWVSSERVWTPCTRTWQGGHGIRGLGSESELHTVIGPWAELLHSLGLSFLTSKDGTMIESVS